MAQIQIIQGIEGVIFDASPDEEPVEYSDQFPVGAFTVRLEIGISGQENWRNDPALSISLPGAYEVYWDGRLLGALGVPGQAAADEIPGSTQSFFDLRADDITVGLHMLEIRASNWRLISPDSAYLDVYLLQKRAIDRDLVQRSATVGAVTLLGVLVAVFFIAFEGTVGTGVHRFVFAGLSFGTVALTMLANLPEIVAAPYYWDQYRDIGIVPIAAIVFSLLAYVAFRFLQVKRVFLWVSVCMISVLILSLPQSFLGADHDTRVFVLLALFCAGSGIWAALKNQGRWRSVIAASVVGLISIQMNTESLHLFLFFIACALSLQAATEYRSSQMFTREKKLNAARLELELLKQSFQPHFLMNTLAATQELIETAPAQASKFIEALAFEFQALLAMTGKSQVTLKEEIDLCQRYLKVMELRLETRLTLEIAGKVPDFMIPPGILHTLLENALSHNAHDLVEVPFLLTVKSTVNGIVIELKAPLAAEIKPSPLSSGAGTRYIEASLRESFGDHWTMEAKSADGYWQTTVTIELF